jgi:dephospho-CoA kinase
MRIIGLTGGIASGKSTVSAMLAELGAYIVDADRLARRVVETGKPAWQEIVDWLGQGVLLDDGALDRGKLGAVVFADAAARKRLEAITHPRIRSEMCGQVAAAAEQGFGVAVLDVPLLFETGWDKMANETWVVAVDAATQLERLMRRDGLTRGDAKARIAAQMALAEKVRLADVVIDNSKDVESTRRQVQIAWQRLNQ